MSKANKKLHKLLTVKRPLEEEIDDPRLWVFKKKKNDTVNFNSTNKQIVYRLPNAIKEKTYLFYQLQYLKDERKKITSNMEKYNTEKAEFKENFREELIKIKVS